MDSDSDNLKAFDRDQCIQLLKQGLFGRILYTSGALPAIAPVNYVLDEETIVIRTGGLAELAAAGREEVVAFEIDDIDPIPGTGWSVVVTGRVSEITSEPELAHVRALDLPSWAMDGDERYIRIYCELVTGRCLHNRLSDGDGDLTSPTDVNS